MLVGVVGCSLLAMILVACAPPSRGAPDAAADAIDPFCGDGIEDREGGEDCDDGERNGTSVSHCTTQCDEYLEPFTVPTYFVDLGMPIADSNYLGYETGTGALRFAFTNYDQRGIVIARGVRNGPPPQPTPELISLRVAHDPISMGRFRTTTSSTHQWPAWLERGPTGPTRLYYAEADATGTPPIHELPYPFPDGIRPEIVSRTWYHAGLLIVDQAGDGSGDLLVAMVVARSPTDVRTFRARFPSPGGRRALAYDTGFYPVDGTRNARQLVQFFEEPGSYLTIDILGDRSDVFADTGIAFAERARGPWARRVIAADAFWKNCPDDKTGDNPAFRDPLALAVLDDQGAIYVEQFDGHASSAGEQFVTPFATAPGARSLMGLTSSLITWVPSGHAIRFHDGDCSRMGSVALAPLSRRFTEPWTVATQQTGVVINNPAWHSGTADSRLFTN